MMTQQIHDSSVTCASKQRRRNVASVGELDFDCHSSPPEAHLIVRKCSSYKNRTYLPKLTGTTVLSSYSSGRRATNKRGEDHMEVRHITCMIAATITGSLLIFGAASPVEAQQPLIVEGQHHFDPETQRVVHYGDLNL